MSRLENVTASCRCAYCSNSGLVVVDSGDLPLTDEERKVRGPRRTVYAEAYGPCPYCERGYLIEFPVPDPSNYHKEGAWGTDGYWRGRPANLTPVDTGEKPLPPDENLRRARKLAAELRRAGHAVSLSGSGHWLVQTEAGGGVWFAQTPSDRRWIRNTRASLRRAGIEL